MKFSGMTKDGLRIIANLHCDNGYFSLTGEIGNHTFGCIHDEIIEQWPELEFAASMHLSNSTTGEPMHAIANGFYWLQGCNPEKATEKYYGGENSCAMLKKHLRCTDSQLEYLIEKFPTNKDDFKELITTMGFFEQWKYEAEKLRTFIKAS